MLQKYRNLIIAVVMGLTLLIIIGALTNNIRTSKSYRIGTKNQTLTRAESKVEYNDSNFAALNNGTNTATASEDSKVASPEALQAKSKENFANRKIILSGNMEVETNKFDNATKAISTRVQNIGGYIESSEVTGVKSENGNFLENRTANYTIRIPATKFQSFMNEIGTIGVVTSKHLGGEDVTSQYIDSQARLKSQKVKEARLIDILKKAKNLTDVLAIETELENTRYEIENLTSSLKKWDNLVTYSTLTISLREVEESKELVKKPITLPDKMSDAFNNSLKLLGDFSKGLLVALVAALPFIVILGVIFGVVLFIAKRKGNGNSNNN